MIHVDCDYPIGQDIEFLLEAEKIGINDLSEKAGISSAALDNALNRGHARDDVCEKFYAYAYKNKYRLNAVKNEIRKEQYGNVLFHGSKEGLSVITSEGSRENCDFGKGFYLGESYSQALSFVVENVKSSVYSFRYSLDGLTLKKFDCNLDWMLAICYYRRKLKNYASNQMIRDILRDVDNADVIIAPIADNRMFHIMTQFSEGEINADVALHSLSASGLGSQYVFRTDRALDNLIPIERYFLSDPERNDCVELLRDRSNEIDTKLKLAKREFKTGLYIEELLQ